MNSENRISKKELNRKFGSSNKKRVQKNPKKLEPYKRQNLNLKDIELLKKGTLWNH